MNSYRTSLAALLVLFVLITASVALGQAAGLPDARDSNVSKRVDLGKGEKYVPGEVLVRFKPGTSRQAMLSSHAKVGGMIEREFKSVERLHLVKLSAGVALKRALRDYRKDPNVLYAEPNYIVHALALPNDPLFPQQWGLSNTGQNGGTVGADIDALQAWNITTGSANVVVAVIDSGIDYTHPDLAPNMFSTTNCNPNGSGTGAGTVSPCFGIAPVYNTSDPMDDLGHGTHVAGIIGAVGNNALGVSGVNWNVKLVACKFLDASGSGSAGDAITCLDYVKTLKDQGVNVVASNNSWGGSTFSQALSDAIQANQQDGILFIAAAGNNFSDNDVVSVYPANFFLPNIVSVAATSRFDRLATFSDVGQHTVHLGAPGQEILSTLPGATYGVYSGTSMAAPFVTGVAALLSAQDSTRDWRAIKNLILAGGDPIPALAQTISRRRLDAYGSMTCSNSTVSERLQPSMNSVPATAGQPLTLAALNINCAQPAGPMQVTVSPGDQTINLLDDGAAPDQAPEDGIYTGQWTPPGLGDYSLTFSNGDTVQATVLSNYTAGETTFSYQTITGTNLNLGDDDVATITSPFPVQFGGGAFSTLYVSSNGTISFTNAFGDFINWDLPLNYDGPPPTIDQPVVTLVAPFWEDLYPVKGTDQNVFWDVTGAEPNRQLVVEWRNVRTFECQTDENATVTFQAVFSESSSDFSFNYSNVVFGGACSDQDYGAEATIGMQVTQNVGTEWSYQETAVGNNVSLLWTIPASNAAPNPVPTITSLSPSSVPMDNGDTIITLTGTGFVPNSQAFLNPGPRLLTTYVSSTELQALVDINNSLIGGPWGSFEIYVTNPPPGGGTSQEVTLTVVAPNPQITSISPTSIPAGSYGFVLTINGSNFFQGTYIVWNNSPFGGWVTSVSSSQLVLSVPEFLIATPGTVAITLYNGSSESNAATLTITAQTTSSGAAAPSSPKSPGSPNPPGATGSKAVPFPGHFPGWKATKEMGSDFLAQFLRHRAGLASSSPPLPFSRNVQPESSTSLPPPPGFNFRPTLPADFMPTAVVTGDFNGDGHIDWAIANAGSDNIWIYLGKGDGTAQLPIIIPLKGTSPVALAAADMNHDGKLDLIVAEADSLSVGILLGNGDGTFGPEREFYAPGYPESLAVADFDGDGNLDVVAGLFGDGATGQLVFFPGDGTGMLGTPVFHFAETGLVDTFYLAVADLNGDGLPDIVALDFGISPAIGGVNFFDEGYGNGATVFLNQGNGIFKPYQQFYKNINFNFEPPQDQVPPGASLGSLAVAMGHARRKKKKKKKNK